DSAGDDQGDADGQAPRGFGDQVQPEVGGGGGVDGGWDDAVADAEEGCGSVERDRPGEEASGHGLGNGDGDGPFPEDGVDGCGFDPVEFRDGGAVAEDHVDFVGVDVRVGEGAAQGRFQGAGTAASGRRVERGGVARDNPVDAGAAGPGCGFLFEYQQCSAFPGHVPSGVGREREVGAAGVVRGADPSRSEVGDPPPGAQGAVDTPGEHDTGAFADLPAGVGDRVCSPGLVGDEDSRGAAHLVADGDLTGVDRVEPGERLVGADVAGAFGPQVAEFPFTELVAA